MKPTLLVLAAGMGSRYGGVKQIDSVGKNGECLLDFANFDAKKSGFGNVVFIIRKILKKIFVQNCLIELQQILMLIMFFSQGKVF